MNIKISKYAGFCYGVKRAIDLLNQECNSSGGPVYVLGEIVHNPQVLADFEKKGVKFVKNIKGLKNGTLVLPAHGTADKVVEQAKKQGLRIVDATCPKVKKIHILSKQFEKQGYQIVIFGDPGHFEVKNIAANLKKPIIADQVEAVKKNISQKIFLVSQTTQNSELFRNFKKSLNKNFKQIVFRNTICETTRQRQQDAIKLSSSVDLAIIIGGKKSANTRRLTEICSKFTKAYHIETAKQLKKEWFKGVRQVFVTAGASTPALTIQNTIKKIKKYG